MPLMSLMNHNWSVAKMAVADVDTPMLSPVATPVTFATAIHWVPVVTVVTVIEFDVAAPQAPADVELLYALNVAPVLENVTEAGAVVDPDAISIPVWDVRIVVAAMAEIEKLPPFATTPRPVGEELRDPETDPRKDTSHLLWQ